MWEWDNRRPALLCGSERRTVVESIRVTARGIACLHRVGPKTALKTMRVGLMMKICLSLTFGMVILDLVVSGVTFSRSQTHQAPLAPKSVSMTATAWNILYSPSMPAHPNPVDGGWYFDFPACNGTNACSVNYVTVPVDLVASTHVKAVFRIATTGAPAFHYRLEASNTCDYPAHVRYILQRRGDDLTAKSEFYRWFSSSGFQLKEGSAELSVPLEPNSWVSVLGKRGDANDNARTGFQQALQNLSNVGFVFGGGCFYGHGVNVIGGSARFLASAYSLK